MIDLYSWPTPNGMKVHILLEELNLSYEVHPVDITQGEQFREDFLKISPNNKIPAIVDRDHENLSVFESGAILFYLAEKTGQFFPTEGEKRYRVMQWLMFQMGSLGPMLGQAHHFRQYAPERIAYGVERYTNEAKRLYRVLEKQLSQYNYIVGDEYSIADIAVFPWIISYEKQGLDIEEFPSLKRWFENIAARPAVEKGRKLLKGYGQDPAKLDKKSQETLFGNQNR